MDGTAIAELGNTPGRANLHKIKGSLLDMFRLRCLLEIQVELSRGTVRSLSREVRSKMRARVTTLEVISKARI